jgi:hypothetical protein
VKLSEIKYFKPLMWAIKKYCPDEQLPNPHQLIGTYHNWYIDHKNIKNNINYLFEWADMEEGTIYWDNVHIALDKRYNKEGSDNELYFPSMVEDYEQHRKIQLELDL